MVFKFSFHLTYKPTVLEGNMNGLCDIYISASPRFHFWWRGKIKLDICWCGYETFPGARWPGWMSLSMLVNDDEDSLRTSCTSLYVRKRQGFLRPCGCTVLVEWMNNNWWKGWTTTGERDEQQLVEGMNNNWWKGWTTTGGRDEQQEVEGMNNKRWKGWTTTVGRHVQQEL